MTHTVEVIRRLPRFAAVALLLVIVAVAAERLEPGHDDEPASEATAY